MHKNRGVKTGQLDERIDNTKVQIEHTYGEWCEVYFTGPQYLGIANTMVQLFRRRTSGVMSASQPIRSDERNFKNGQGHTARPSGGIR